MIKIKFPTQKQAISPLLGVFIGEGEMAVALLNPKSQSKTPTVARTASIQWAVEDGLKSLGERLKELTASCGINAHEIALSISGQDAFVRHYELPMLPKKEWLTAARFEARKYMPFEISDLQCQTVIQKTEDGKRLEVVFTAVRKEVLNSLINDFTKSGFKVVWAEPVFMSLLRLFLTAETKASGDVRVLIEASKNGSLHTVFEKKGVLLVAQRATVTTFAVDGAVDDESYLSEVQLAFDYFNKSFRRIPISSVTILRSESKDLKRKIQTELNLPCSDLDLKSFGLDSSVDDGSTYRAAGAALVHAVGSKHKFSNLLNAQKTSMTKRSLNILAVPNLSPAKERVLLLRIAATECAIALLLIAVFAGVSYAKQISLNHQLKVEKKQIALLNPKLIKKSVSDLKKIKKEHESEMNNRKKLEKSRDYLTLKLNLIAKSAPSSMELTQMSYVHSENLTTVNIAGILTQTTLQQGVVVINKFVSDLQSAENDFKSFNDVIIKNINEVKQPNGQAGIVFVVNAQKKAE